MKRALENVAGVCILSASLLLSCATLAAPSAAPQVERVGPPTFFMQDSLRYLAVVPDDLHPWWYPIPVTPVTRETYMTWIEESGLLDLADTPQRGTIGPNELLPVLAKFVQTGERKWGDACVAMLRDFHRAVKEDATKKGWNELCTEPPAVLPLYRRYLTERGLLREPQDGWFREMVIEYTRTLHVWNSAPTFWRGPCHRAQPEGVIRGLVAKWYPDIPEAAAWRKYSDQVFADFWQYKDLTENDTGYSMGPTFANMLGGTELRGSDEFITDPAMRKLWERHLAEITPDGAINPYGPNSGWNSTAGYRLWMFELIAAKTGDGRFRFAAHRLMNYLLYQKEPLRRDRGSWVRETTQHVALAWLVADEKVKPVTPPSGSQLLHRKQVLRIGGKKDAAQYLEGLDPAPDKAMICCNLLVLGDDVPSKLVFRSGWKPGDLYGLVDLFIGADPLNPGGIVGLTRWGAPLTQAVSAKGSDAHNRLVIEDLSGEAPRRHRKLPVGVIGETWSRNGESPATRVSVPLFDDRQHGTFAVVEVTDWETLPVKVTREFAFIKNRFLVVRDVAAFDVGFRARLGPIWNTQNIGLQIGTHFANTFFSQPCGGGSHDNPLNTPPYDLLVWFAPKPGAKLQVIDRTGADPRTKPVPGQLRYVWEGEAKTGDRLHFTQLYWPHPPYHWRPASNMTGAKRTWLDGGEHADSAGAAGITALLDTPDASVIRCNLEKDRVEWIVCNPSGRPLNVAGLTGDARFAYLDMRNGKLASASVHQARSLALSGEILLPTNARRNFDK